MKKLFVFAAVALFSMAMFAEDISCVEAKAKIDASATGEFTVVGYVTQIVEFASTEYNNTTFWMADDMSNAGKKEGRVFEVYRMKYEGTPLADVPVVGDKVAVTATLKKYNSTYETNQISSFEIRVKGDFSRYTEDDLVVGKINVEEAVEAGMKLKSGETSLKSYEVTGYVVSIPDDGAYSAQYGNMTFYMSDDKNAERGDLEAYRAKMDAPGAVKGDKVVLSGHIQRYDGVDKQNNPYTSLEIANGKAVVVKETAIENTAVSVKAQKVMENGQLYIIRNGIKYNAAGAVVE